MEQSEFQQKDVTPPAGRHPSKVFLVSGKEKAKPGRTDFDGGSYLVVPGWEREQVEVSAGVQKGQQLVTCSGRAGVQLDLNDGAAVGQQGPGVATVAAAVHDLSSPVVKAVDDPGVGWAPNGHRLAGRTDVAPS